MITAQNANRDTVTGLPYGIIRTDNIDSDILQDLLYSRGKDVSYDEALAEHLATKRREFEQAQEELNIGRAERGEDREYDPSLGEDDPEFDENYETDQFSDSYQCDEPIITGEHEGVVYRTTWLGGAQHLYIFKSPVLTKCRPCSPCVPNAGDLDSVGDYLAYGVPVGWLDYDFLKGQCGVAGSWMLEDDGYVWDNDDRTYLGDRFETEGEAWEDCYKANLQVSLKYTLIRFYDGTFVCYTGTDYLDKQEAGYLYPAKSVVEVHKILQRGMKLAEIKAAVDAGKRVYWSHTGYKVVKATNDYLIVFEHNDSVIGLTHADGVTMNGKEEDFFVTEN